MKIGPGLTICLSRDFLRTLVVLRTRPRKANWSATADPAFFARMSAPGPAVDMESMETTLLGRRSPGFPTSWTSMSRVPWLGPGSTGNTSPQCREQSVLRLRLIP